MATTQAGVQSRASALTRIVAILALLAGTLAVFTTNAGAASTAVDYAQCANGAPGHEGPDCPDGWINGILQASNSHYSEDQVTPQRLTANVPGAGNHSITLVYQVAKGTTHAYDSLATWNFTETSLGFEDRCDGLTPSKCAAGVSDVTPDDSIGIPDDPNSVGALHTGGNGSVVTATHMIPAGAGRMFHMFGDTGVNPDMTGFDPYVHSFSGGDEYASLTVRFTTAAAGKVQLLFGGHLAAPTGPRGWGPGFGASSINGGPYHIKWDAFDGESVGQRDNQIMGSAILSFQVQITTVASPTSVVIGTTNNLSDTATISGGSNPTGTVTFNLYAAAANCTGTPVATATGTLSNSVATGTALNVTLTTLGDYYWVASYPGDGINQAQTSACNDPAEKVTVIQASPTITTAASPSSATVGVSASLSDTATFSGGFNVSGTVTFSLYAAAANCTGTPVATATGSVSGTTATGTTSVTFTLAGDYYWVASYPGDTNNNSYTSACNDPNEKVTASQATPSGTTTMNLSDNVTVSSTGVTPTGNVTFTLYKDDGANTCTAGTLIGSDTKALAGGSATSSTYSNLAAGTYRWYVTYAGDANNSGGVVSNCTEVAVITY